MAAFAPALTPMLATPPARMFAATNMLVCVLLLLHFCSRVVRVVTRRKFVQKCASLVAPAPRQRPMSCRLAKENAVPLLGVDLVHCFETSNEMVTQSYDEFSKVTDAMAIQVSILRS